MILRSYYLLVFFICFLLWLSSDSFAKTINTVTFSPLSYSKEQIQNHPNAEAAQRPVRQDPSQMLEGFNQSLEQADTPNEMLSIYEHSLMSFNRGAPVQLINSVRQKLDSLDFDPDYYERINANKDLAKYIMLNRTQPDSALYYGNSALEYFRQHSTPAFYLAVTNDIIILLLMNQRFLEAEKKIFKAIELTESILEDNGDDDIQIALRNLYGNAGRMYSMVQAYDQAAFMFEKALDIQSDSNSECNVRLSLGGVFFEMGMFVEASESIQPCFTMESLNPNIAAQARISQHRVYKALNDTTAAADILIQAIPYAERGSQPDSQLPFIYSFLIGMALDRNDLKTASSYAHQILDIPPQALISPNIMVFVQFTAARYLFMDKQYERALIFADQVIALFERSNTFSHDYADGIFGLKGRILEQLGDIEGAMAAYNLQTEHFNRIEIKERELARSMAQVRYQLVAAMASTNRTRQQYGLLLGLASIFTVSILLVLFMIFRRYQNSQSELILKENALSDAEKKHMALQSYVNNQTILLKQRLESNGENDLIEFQRNFSISARAISHIKSEGNYIRIHTFGNGDKLSYQIIRMTLKECTSKLPSELFCRIHRQVIVNKCFIERIESCDVYLRGGIKLKMGKAYTSNINMQKFLS